FPICPILDLTKHSVMTATHRNSSKMSADDLLVTGRRILSAHPVGALFQHRDAAPDELLWVGPVALTPDDHHLVMLSSRYSRVALAVRDHPNVIWTFTDG